MKIKVGKDYILPEETRKRNKKEVIYTTIWMALLVGWISFLVIISIINEFWTFAASDTSSLFYMFNIPTFIFCIGFFTYIKREEHIRTTEFLIHSYERWNYEESKYETLFITESVELTAHYIYNKYTGDSIKKWSEKEIEEHCRNLSGRFDSFIGYQTEKSAMRSILNSVKEIIKQEKESNNIKVKNIRTLETFTVGELRDKLDNKEFEDLFEE